MARGEPGHGATRCSRHDFSVSYVAQVGSAPTPDWVHHRVAVVVARGLDPLLGRDPGRVRRRVSRACADSAAPRVHAAARSAPCSPCGAFFAFLIAGPAQPVRPSLARAARRPGPQPAAAEPRADDHPPAHALPGLRGHDGPVRHRRRPRCSAGSLGRDPGWRRCGAGLLVAWIFLSVGIVLGGWWAYEVLGWGGYWAWDPVENASLPALAHRHRRSCTRRWCRTARRAEALDDARWRWPASCSPSSARS